MKKLILIAALFASPVYAGLQYTPSTGPHDPNGWMVAGDVYVAGYYRRDGTYVRPHVRSAPDGNCWNNYGGCR